MTNAFGGGNLKTELRLQAIAKNMDAIASPLLLLLLHPHRRPFSQTTLFHPPLKHCNAQTCRPLPIFADITPRFYATRWNSASYQALSTRLRHPREQSLVPTVPVQVAHELLHAGHRYLDVRTPEEFVAGHADGAINIPYIYRKGTGVTKNHNFIEQVLLQFGKDDEIIVGCQSGKTSQMAAAELVAVGFSSLTDLSGGYSAWIQSGLTIRSKC